MSYSKIVIPERSPLHHEAINLKDLRRIHKFATYTVVDSLPILTGIHFKSPFSHPRYGPPSAKFCAEGAPYDHGVWSVDILSVYTNGHFVIRPMYLAMYGIAPLGCIEDENLHWHSTNYALEL